jgi:hypothetical protein
VCTWNFVWWRVHRQSSTVQKIRLQVWISIVDQGNKEIRNWKKGTKNERIILSCCDYYISSKKLHTENIVQAGQLFHFQMHTHPDPLPHTPSWRSAYLVKHKEQLYMLLHHVSLGTAYSKFGQLLPVTLMPVIEAGTDKVANAIYLCSWRRNFIIRIAEIN